MQNQVKYMEDNDDNRLSNMGVPDVQIMEFRKWPLPLRHEKFRIASILVCSMSLFIIGVRMAAKNAAINVQSFNYGDICPITDGQFSSNCSFNQTITSKIESPIHVYYHITKFWQNHFLFVRSMSEEQYYGTDFMDVESCEGNSWGGELSKGKEGKILVPCGLQGWSYFNDDILLNVRKADGSLKCSNCLNYEDIALDVDKDRFTTIGSLDTSDTKTSMVDAYYTPNGKAVRGEVDIPDLNDESLMVWLRYGSTSNFKKIHSRINVDLDEQDVLEFHVTSKFNTQVLGGSKSLILSQAKSFGGKHKLLSVMFILSGALPLIITISILVIHAYYSTKNGQSIW